jgi:hypothetical protein
MAVMAVMAVMPAVLADQILPFSLGHLTRDRLSQIVQESPVMVVTVVTVDLYISRKSMLTVVMAAVAAVAVMRLSSHSTKI